LIFKVLIIKRIKKKTKKKPCSKSALVALVATKTPNKQKRPNKSTLLVIEALKVALQVSLELPSYMVSQDKCYKTGYLAE